MKALAMPISSRTAADMDWVCFWANAPRILEERSATCWQTLASSWDSLWLAGCIPHDAIGVRRTLCFTCVVKIVQMSYRLAHREECLMRVQRTSKQNGYQLARAAGTFLPLAFQ